MIKQDITALYKASYGLYLLSAKDNEQDAGLYLSALQTWGNRFCEDLEMKKLPSF